MPQPIGSSKDAVFGCKKDDCYIFTWSLRTLRWSWALSRTKSSLNIRLFCLQLFLSAEQEEILNHFSNEANMTHDFVFAHQIKGSEALF
jgi:hypothetical protein